MLAMLFGCGFRRSELVGLELDEIQMRQGHWAVVDLIGKGGHIRTVPIPTWVKSGARSVDTSGQGHGGKDLPGASPGRERCGAEASRRMSCGTWCKVLLRESGLGAYCTARLAANLCEAVPRRAAASWSRFSSYWAMHRSRRRNAISAANRISDIRSTIFLTSERTGGRMNTKVNLPGENLRPSGKGIPARGRMPPRRIGP